MNPTRYMVQVTHDDGKTWEDLPEVTAQPCTRNANSRNGARWRVQARA